MKYSDILEEIDSMLDLDPSELSSEDQAKLDEYLDELASQEQDKIDSFCKYIRLLDAQESCVEEEIKYLRAKKESLGKKAAKLKGYYLQLMQKHNLKKVSGNVYSISTRNSQVVIYEGDIDQLADKYKRVKTTVEVDKVALKQALQAGAEIDGARIATRTSLTIR